MQSFNKLYNIVISAVCMGLAQHPLGLGWIAWFSLIPLFYSIKDENRFLQLSVKIFIWGFLYHLVSLFWLVDNIGVDSRYIGLLTMLLANIVCTFNIFVIFSLWHLINKLNGKTTWISLPFIWTSVDYLSSLLEVSFPWSSIANTQAQDSLLSFIQFVELTGMFGITFWLVCLNVSLFYLYRNKTLIKSIDSMAIFTFPLIVAFLIDTNNNDGNKIDFAIVQPNISIDDKNEKSSTMIRSLLDQSIPELRQEQLLVWPETAFYDFGQPGPAILKKELHSKNIQLLTGVYEFESDKKYYNSIYYLNKSNNYKLSEAQKYRKIKMVPGAEYVPFSNVFPFLKNIALSGNFTKGNEYTIFSYNDYVPFSAMVCIESTYSYLSRNMVANGAEFIVYVANDGWYLKPPQAQQHAKQTILRAIETRKPILRCGNTGITWVVNHKGEVLNSLDQNTKGVLTSNDIEVYSNDKKTLYVILGDWFSYLCIVISLCLILNRFYIFRYRK